jgi:hypothetical protein
LPEMSRAHSQQEAINRLGGVQSEGIAKAKANGIYKGRPKSPDTTAKVHKLKSRGMGASAIAKKLGISRATVYRHLEINSSPSNLTDIIRRCAVPHLHRTACGADRAIAPDPLPRAGRGRDHLEIIAVPPSLPATGTPRATVQGRLPGTRTGDIAPVRFTALYARHCPPTNAVTRRPGLDIWA